MKFLSNLRLGRSLRSFLRGTLEVFLSFYYLCFWMWSPNSKLNYWYLFNNVLLPDNVFRKWNTFRNFSGSSVNRLVVLGQRVRPWLQLDAVCQVDLENNCFLVSNQNCKFLYYWSEIIKFITLNIFWTLSYHETTFLE